MPWGWVAVLGGKRYFLARWRRELMLTGCSQCSLCAGSFSPQEGNEKLVPRVRKAGGLVDLPMDTQLLRDGTWLIPKSVSFPRQYDSTASWEQGTLPSGTVSLSLQLCQTLFNVSRLLPVPWPSLPRCERQEVRGCSPWKTPKPSQVST